MISGTHILSRYSIPWWHARQKQEFQIIPRPLSESSSTGTPGKVSRMQWACRLSVRFWFQMDTLLKRREPDMLEMYANFCEDDMFPSV